jgi:hypothetical protein
MEELLNSFVGKKIDVSCGSGPVLRGEVTQVKAGVLYLRDEDGKSAFVVIDKIATVCECSDSASRPGFIGQ